MMIMVEDVVGDVGGDMVFDNMRGYTLVPYNQWSYRYPTHSYFQL